MGRHLVPTGFVIYDITAEKDVAELDECRQDGCPGRCEIPVQSHG